MIINTIEVVILDKWELSLVQTGVPFASNKMRASHF